MLKRTATAEWKGGIKSGSGQVSTESKTLDHGYDFAKRFEQEKTTNPEEMLGASHASCFSMAFSGGLEGAGYPAESIHTEDTVHLEKQGEGFVITQIDIHTEAKVPGIDEQTFQQEAQKAKENCPISLALKGVTLNLNAKLKS